MNIIMLHRSADLST